MDSISKVVSYPKCGRTWLRLLIGHYLVIENSLSAKDALKCEKLIRSVGLSKISFTHDEADWNTKDIISHSQLSTDKTQYKSSNVIFLHRDIKDTLVSSYFQATRRNNTFNGTLSEFIRDEYYGAEKIHRFNQIWFENQNVPNKFMSLTYEELHNDAEQTLSQVMRFLGRVRVDSNAIRVATEKCRFENMRQAELKNTHDSFRLRPGDPSDPESFKLRKGKIGGYVDYLSENDIKYIDKIGD